MEEVYTDWKNPKLSNCWTGNKFVRNVNNDKKKISARRISGVSKKKKITLKFVLRDSFKKNADFGLSI